MYPVLLTKEEIESIPDEQNRAYASVAKLLETEPTTDLQGCLHKSGRTILVYHNPETYGGIKLKSSLVNTCDYIFLVTGKGRNMKYVGWHHRDTFKKHAEKQGELLIVEQNQMFAADNFRSLFGLTRIELGVPEPRKKFKVSGENPTLFNDMELPF